MFFNSFYEIRLPGLMKIVNKKEFLNSPDEEIAKLVEECQDKHKETFYFHILIYIDHKKFEISYNFYEVLQIGKYGALLAAIDSINEKTVEFIEEDII